MITLRYRARKGSLLTDPSSPGRYLGRTQKATPPEGWPAGTKKEDIFVIDKAAEVTKADRARFDLVLDALRKGIDLEPADDATARYVGQPIAKHHDHAHHASDKRGTDQ